MQVITSRATTLDYGSGSYTFAMSHLPQDVPAVFDTKPQAAAQLAHAVAAGSLRVWAPQDAPAIHEAEVAPISEPQDDLTHPTQASEGYKPVGKAKGRR